MIIDVKKLRLWGHDVVIRAKAQTPHVVFDALEDEACFYYVMKGRSELYMPTQKIDILEEQGVSLKCGNYVGKFLTDSRSQEAEILIVKFTKDIVRRIYVDDLPALFEKVKRNKAKQSKVITNSRLLEDYVRGLLFYIDNPHLVVEELLILKIRELFILLANSDDSNTIQQLIENMFNDADFNFRNVIEKNYFSNLQLTELAHLCMMSLSSFKRKFKQEFGQPPHRFFLHKKLEKAQGLIKNTSLPLAEVSIQCGFTEYSNFSTAFKKKFEVSPREFRFFSS